MSSILSQRDVDSEKRVQIIRFFPCFSKFTKIQMAELAALTQVIEYPPHTVIVKENDLVDSVYFIVDGAAEVTREMPYRKKIRQVPVAKLQTGEGIGLNDTGFYSSTGKRTATVTSLSTMCVLRLDLKDLSAFLQTHHLESEMVSASQNMLRMRFIKQSLPFSKLSYDRLQALAEHVEEVRVPIGTVIFKQGDEGDKCYLIQSGKVDISSSDELGITKQLAELKSPALFGEATLISHSPRNASAIATEETILLELNHDYLSELMESETNVANMFMTLMVDRSRPTKNPNTIIHHRIAVDGQEIAILKNPDNGVYFKLSPEGEFIWDKLDGKQTLQEITLDLAEKFNVFAPDVVVALISRLAKAKFIYDVEVRELNQGKKSLFSRMTSSVKKLLDFRYAFGDADQWVSRAYNKYIHYFFTKPAQLLLGLIIITGLSLFIASTSDVLGFFSVNHASLFLLFVLLPFSLVEIMLHELGHAFAVKAFGREVHYIGVGWYYFAPVAFTDTSDMWLAGRKQRMLVNLAGVHVDLIVAGLASMFILFIPNPYVQSILWLFALYTYLGAFRMLSPLQELDGYYFLMDWVEKPHLRQASVLWLINKFPRALRHPTLFRENKPEVYYWLACLVFLVLVTILTLVIQTFVFSVLGMQAKNPYLILALPFVVAIISSLSIFADIRNR